MQRLLEHIPDARALAQIIVDMLREPLVALDGDAKILFASGSFLRSFQMDAKDVENQTLFALDGGAWDIPALRALLEPGTPENALIGGLEIARDFPRIGRRVLDLRGRRARYGDDAPTILLLSFEDVTERRAIEWEKDLLQKQTDDLLHQKEMLLEEMQHRIVNSLQIIASILLLKARAVTSEETRQHLQDAHRRVMSVAAVQQHLHSAGHGDLIEIAPYLSKLCGSLAESMIGESRPASLDVVADGGALPSADAVSLGLIVTELVINALKYAFPIPTTSAKVAVRYEMNGTNWELSVSDNGIGKADVAARGGLGTSLVNALAHQLDAQVKAKSGPGGTRVSITHATFTSRVPQVA